jgi:threonine dehydrogenase-like Zn-dependent dehydrogenase
MKALHFDGQIRLVQDYPRPHRVDGEVLIRVTKAGVCNTDLEIIRGYMDFRGVPGHEFVGVVEETDNGRLVGQRVVGEINCPCGQCELCRAGKGRHCPERTVLGIAGRDGAFAQYMTLPEQNLHAVPDEVPDDDAVFAEPLAAAFRILEQTEVRDDDTVIVLGDGKLGLLVTQVVHTKTDRVVLIGRHEENLALAAEFGVKTFLENQSPDIHARIVVDCTGSSGGLQQAIAMAEPEGVVVIKSTVAEESCLAAANVVVNEITLKGSRCGPFEPALDALRERKVAVEPLVSGKFDLDAGVEALAAAGRSGTLKVIIEISSL